MAGIITLANQREPAPQQEPDPDAQTVVLDSADMVSTPGKPNVVVDFPDGSVSINLNAQAQDSQPLKDTKFGANLALHLGESYLGTLADELLRGIEEDELSRQDWLEERAEGIKLLALRIEKPSNAQAGASAGVDNTSRSRNTLLLEACLRFQATASGELLPTAGPVKVEDRLSKDTMEGDELAQLLEDDFNYYLTKTASEYVPDTERMLLWTAAGGSGFKKVYRCPIRRRPVAESVDAADLCVSNAATDLANADRVTFTSRMRQSVMKRMQYLKAYRDIELSLPGAEPLSSVDEEKMNVTGIMLSNRPEDIPYTIKECYCQINLDGDEHKEHDEVTGIPRPYKVTIEKSSRTILEIRRNWRQSDEMERPREVFVKYPFVPGFGFYDIGLIQIAGNPTTAATALLRIMIDGGIYGNFPGGLVAKGSDKQNTTDVSVPPGGFAPIDVSMAPDGDIRKVVMALPYKEPGPAIMALYKDVVESGSRLAGVPDMAVGEGRQDAPVGTTIALIEQAIKVTDAVHKRLHNAQSKEFELIRDLFKEYPEDFWRFNQDRDPQWDAAKLTKALNDYNLVPRADPNTSSQVQRILRAQALYQMARANPELFQISTVLDYILRTLGIQNPDSFTQPAQSQGQAPDPKAQAAMISAQAQQTGAQAKLIDSQTKAKNLGIENQNRDQDRRADLTIAATKLKTEQVIHGQDLQADASAQVREHQHERQMAQGQIQSDNAQHATGILSDHMMQANQQLHEQGLASQQPERQKRARGGKVERPPLHGARKAPDGKWYVRHESGVFMRVDRIH